jgi:hypothetical protein
MISLETAKALKPSNYRGGTITKQGYRLIYILQSERNVHACKSDGYELEHRYVIENAINRKLEKREVVHHINGNKLDNRIENLQLMTNSEHMKLEGLKRPTNPTAIEAMRQINVKQVKEKCKVDDCEKIVRVHGLCSKHEHWQREGKLIIENGFIRLIKKPKAELKLKEKVCKQCGNQFITTSNRGIYCEKCRTPYQFVKRGRIKRRTANVISRYL